MATKEVSQAWFLEDVQKRQMAVNIIDGHLVEFVPITAKEEATHRQNLDKRVVDGRTICFYSNHVRLIQPAK